MNIGKQRYDNIEIPEGLDAAIESGLRRGAGRRRVRRAAKAAAGMAAALCLAFGAANIAPVYAHASEIPVLGEIIRVFRVGSGGEVTDGVHAGADTRGGSVELNFSGAAESVPHYTARRLSAPERLVLSLSGVRGLDLEALSGELLATGAVIDVYRSLVLDDSRVEINIVLAGGWDCEITEYGSPGSLVLDFIPAEAGGGTYFLRTGAMPWGEALALICEEYHAEEPTQLKTAGGEYAVAIGEYASAEEAEAALEALREAHGDVPFYVAEGAANEIPEE